MANPALPQPPRPAVWEIPDLKDETKYFVRSLPLLDDISDRLVDSLEAVQAYQGATVADSLSALQVQRQLIRFLRGRVELGDQTPWEPHQFLGRGGFGRVATWVKRDENGNVIDELAVKEQQDPPGAEWTRYTEPGNPTPPYRGLLNEAVLQKQLNEYGCENILHLRGYRFITNVAPVAPRNQGNDDRTALITRRSRRGAGRPSIQSTQANTDQTQPLPPIPANRNDLFRFYLEFAPHQTLTKLIERYRAWDQLLPEPFLWHVFDSLAAALEILARGPNLMFSSTGRTRSEAKTWNADWGVVHCDIKPENIFLGYERWKTDQHYINGGSALFGYPVIKLADFGLATVTGKRDRGNVMENYWKTTECYKPPEHQFYGLNWAKPPNNKRYPLNIGWEAMRDAEMADPSFHYGNATNMWAVGKVMYDLMTLSRRWDLDHYRHAQRDQSEVRYIGNGKHFLPLPAWKDWRFERIDDNLPPYHIHSPYSIKLVNLIRECLRPRIRLRPKVDALRRRTKAGLAHHESIYIHPMPGTGSKRRPARRSKAKDPPLPLTVNVPRVYLDHTINQMPAGNIGHLVDDHGMEEYAGLIDRLTADSAWPPLNPSHTKWDHARNHIGPQLGPRTVLDRNIYSVQNGRIWFANVPGGGGGAAGGGGSGGGAGDAGGTGLADGNNPPGNGNPPDRGSQLLGAGNNNDGPQSSTNANTNQQPPPAVTQQLSGQHDGPSSPIPPQSQSSFQPPPTTTNPDPPPQPPTTQRPRARSASLSPNSPTHLATVFEPLTWAPRGPPDSNAPPPSRGRYRYRGLRRQALRRWMRDRLYPSQSQQQERLQRRMAPRRRRIDALRRQRLTRSSSL